MTEDLSKDKNRVPVALRPAQAVVTGFAVVIATGTVLLRLPFAVEPGVLDTAQEASGRIPAQVTGWVDALFTATSATCLTGLVTVDTQSHWSVFGQVIILVLIQIGGLGIMALASFLGYLIAGRIGFHARLNTIAEGRASGIGDVRRVLRNVVLLTLVIEAALAITLSIRFCLHYGLSPANALWHGVFHSISAFNNAGFALYSDNYMSFSDDAWILLPTGTGFIIGGLGFPVVIEVFRQMRRRVCGRSALVWSLNTKVVLTGTGILILLGITMVFFMESEGVLRGMSFGERLLGSVFQGITPRTAGFNSLDYGQFHDSTLLGTDFLMFIGGGSGGTAGGVKVATLAVLLAAVIAEIRGRRSVHLMGWRISPRVQRQALTVVTLSVVVVSISVIALLYISGEQLNSVMFEVTSAFGTVGLSTGMTPSLPDHGKIVLVLLMFLGRVGPITLASSLAGRIVTRKYEYPEGRPLIG